MRLTTLQLLPNTMSLATLRAHVWKGGNDVVLHYKTNGRKEIPMPPPSATSEEAAASVDAAGQPPVTAVA